MLSSFDRVPFDVWHQISLLLDIGDYVNLSLVNKNLHDMLRDEVTSRKLIQAQMAHTVEASLAVQNKITSRQALGRVHDIREAVATAQPYSASLMGYGDDFIYNQGVLCYISNDCIRVLNIRECHEDEIVLNLRSADCLPSRSVLPNPKAPLDPQSMAATYKLLNYYDGFVSCLCTSDDNDPHILPLLMVWDVRPGLTSYGKRELFSWRMKSTHKLFVRNDSEFMYYGTLSGHGSHGHLEWKIRGYSLKTGTFIGMRPTQLRNVAGSNIGKTICFEIKNGYFYAISSQNTFEDEEIDWTSYYICVRFPVISPDENEVQWQRIWRRQHREGPINDAWSNISLRTDESTGQLTIVECRNEWRGGGSESTRTCYMQAVDCFEPDHDLNSKNSESKRRDSIDGGSSGPKQGLPRYLPVSYLPDEPLARIIDSGDKPNYEPPKRRLRRNYHSEYTTTNVDSESCASSSFRRDFTISNTKYHGYNNSASSFIDIVNDPAPAFKSYSIPPDRLRLRIASRKRKISQISADSKDTPIVPVSTTKAPPQGHSSEYSDEQFESCGIRMWPSTDAAPELLELLCPTEKAGKVLGASDERFVLYATNSPSLEGERAIILISFDPTVRLRHMRPLPPLSLLPASPSYSTFNALVLTQSSSSSSSSSSPPSPTLSAPSSTSMGSVQSFDSGGDVEVKPLGTLSENKKRRAVTLEESPAWLRVEPAAYLRLDRGFWLR